MPLGLRVGCIEARTVWGLAIAMEHPNVSRLILQMCHPQIFLRDEDKWRVTKLLSLSPSSWTNATLLLRLHLTNNIQFAVCLDCPDIIDTHNITVFVDVDVTASPLVVNIFTFT